MFTALHFEFGQQQQHRQRMLKSHYKEKQTTVWSLYSVHLLNRLKRKHDLDQFDAFVCIIQMVWSILVGQR